MSQRIDRGGKVMEKRRKHNRQRSNEIFVWIGALFAIVVTVGVIIFANSISTRQAVLTQSVNATHYASGVTQRTLTFVKSDQVYSDENHVYVQYTRDIPAGVQAVTVLTDENCVPDRQGITHCKNMLSFTGGGGTIIVTHNHKMTEVPCLAPGEVLRIVPS